MHLQSTSKLQTHAPMDPNKLNPTINQNSLKQALDRTKTDPNIIALKNGSPNEPPTFSKQFTLKKIV